MLAIPLSPFPATPIAQEVWLRIFKLFSAEDLVASALVCRAFRELSDAEQQWRRLYCARWGRPTTQQGDTSWKVRGQAV